jgi:Ca2+/Na+ antiporter
MPKRTMAENSYIGLGLVYLGCLLVQFLLAGMSIFGDPSKWAAHKMFVHLFGYAIPVLMVLSALAGGFFKQIYKELMIIFLLLFAMYFTANMGWKVSWLGAFHPIAGVLLLGAAAAVVWKVLKEPQESVRPIEKNRGLLVWVLAGAAGGLTAGVILSNLIGIISFFVFDQPVGIKFLPFYLAALSAVIVPAWQYKKKQKMKEEKE